ncbi:PREDICTED: uncharacterized protein LOC105142963 [Acromyrmex echinatior]|uniref:uncharacterized protein LOC105142963 n=1 Tax=Acromyrmex echinatior TaxID=103372 RepID=UPI000580DD18|nr:PREDICTED: uncharacterized protein LOC105142963 [Acromyrmex echinatior]
MEDHWIESLKMKFVNIDTSTLKGLLLSTVEKLDEIKKDQNQRFNEDETKIKELTSNLAATKETLHMEIQTLESKNNKLSEEKNYLDELEAENKKLLQEIKQLEGKRTNLMSIKPNLQDQQLLEQGRKKLNLYKDLTRIQWDFEAIHSKHSIQGYVSNRRDYIHHFCYDTQEINKELTDSLWHEIYLSTSEAEVRNENLPPN